MTEHIKEIYSLHFKDCESTGVTTIKVITVQKAKELLKLIQKQVLQFAPKDFDWDNDELNIKIRKQLEELEL